MKNYKECPMFKIVICFAILTVLLLIGAINYVDNQDCKTELKHKFIDVFNDGSFIDTVFYTKKECNKEVIIDDECSPQYYRFDEKGCIKGIFIEMSGKNKNDGGIFIWRDKSKVLRIDKYYAGRDKMDLQYPPRDCGDFTIEMINMGVRFHTEKGTIDMMDNFMNQTSLIQKLEVVLILLNDEERVCVKQILKQLEVGE